MTRTSRPLADPVASRRNLWIDLQVSARMYRSARCRGFNRREARRWVRDTWRDLPVFRAERGIDA